MTQELYKQYRPEAFSEVVGQAEAVRQLTELGKRGAIPHTLLFTGPSGCGKTTLARIVRRKLKVADGDFRELNCADFRGIDMVRDIRDRLGLAGLSGGARLWLIDEAHQLTAPAQDAFLKILEDTPAHAYFVLCTTDPQKLKTTIRTRCTEIKVRQLTQAELVGLVQSVVVQEGRPALRDDIATRLADAADGSPRKALVLLHQIYLLDDPQAQAAVIGKAETKVQAIELCRLLMGKKPQWKQVADILNALKENEEAESVRRMVLGYAQSVLLKSGSPQAAAVIAKFQFATYDSGWPALVLMAYDVVQGLS